MSKRKNRITVRKKGQRNRIKEKDRRQTPITIPYEAVRRILSEGEPEKEMDRGHAWLIYALYLSVNRWEDKEHITIKKAADILGIGERGVRRAKAFLLELDLIEETIIRDEVSGKVMGHEIVVIKPSTLVNCHTLVFDKGGLYIKKRNSYSSSSINGDKYIPTTPKSAEPSKKSKSRKKKLPRKYKDLVDWFHSEQLKNHPKLKHLQNPSKAKVRAAAETIDKLVRIDGFDFEDVVRPAIEYATTDSFWKNNVRSLASLRTKSKRNGESKFVNILYSMGSHENKQQPIEATKTEKVMFDTLRCWWSEVMDEELESKNGFTVIAPMYAFWKQLPGDSKSSSIHKGKAKYFWKTPMLLLIDYLKYVEKRTWPEMSPSAIKPETRMWNRFLREKEQDFDLPLRNRKSA
jgi:hypothetical protein